MKIFVNPAAFNARLQSAFHEATHYAGNSDVVLSAAANHREYIEQTGTELKFVPSAENWLISGKWRIDWLAELDKWEKKNKPTENGGMW